MKIAWPATRCIEKRSTSIALLGQEPFPPPHPLGQMPGDLLAALLARCRSAAPARAVGRHSYSNLSPFFP